MFNNKIKIKMNRIGRILKEKRANRKEERMTRKRNVKKEAMNVKTD